MLVKMQTSTSSNVVGLYQRQRSFLSCRLLALVKLQAFTSCRVALYLHVVNEFLFSNTAGFSTLALVKLQVVAEFKLRYRIIFSQVTGLFLGNIKKSAMSLLTRFSEQLLCLTPLMVVLRWHPWKIPVKLFNFSKNVSR